MRASAAFVNLRWLGCFVGGRRLQFCFDSPLAIDDWLLFDDARFYIHHDDFAALCGDGSCSGVRSACDELHCNTHKAISETRTPYIFTLEVRMAPQWRVGAIAWPRQLQGAHDASRYVDSTSMERSL